MLKMFEATNNELSDNFTFIQQKMTLKFAPLIKLTHIY